MSAPIKRYKVFLPDEIGESVVVLHADHLASHAYDAEKERALFESRLPWKRLERSADGMYVHHWIESEWRGWLACARHAILGKMQCTLLIGPKRTESYYENAHKWHPA